MTRLPQLEQVLRDAAAAHTAQPLPRSPHRWSRHKLAFVAGVTLALTSAAVAATGVLSSGDPVPASSHPSAVPTPANPRDVSVIPLRVDDPDGGPPWAIATYDTRGQSSRCVMIGRVQNGTLGVVGRDGVFGDDGLFHPLKAISSQALTCGGLGDGGSFFAGTSQPPIPASGYTGAPGSEIGGCREPVNLNGPTVSAQTRRRLRNVPVCSTPSLRAISFGFAGRDARAATLQDSTGSERLALSPQQNGAYLFVRRAGSNKDRLEITITYSDGHTCPVLAAPC